MAVCPEFPLDMPHPQTHDQAAVHNGPVRRTVLRDATAFGVGWRGRGQIRHAGAMAPRRGSSSHGPGVRSV